MFSYDDPASSDVQIEDIAAALSKVCRFAGHLPYFYSVAQHVVNTSYIVQAGYEFDALMHDTAEAFTNDLPTPLKHAIPIFKDLEVRIESDMARRFSFFYPLPAPVKLADLQMLGLEKVYIKRDYSEWACLDGIAFDHLLDKVDLTPMGPSEAERLFLARFHELNPNG